MGPGKPLDSAHCGEDNGASPAAEPHFCWTQQERYKAKGLSALSQLPHKSLLWGTFSLLSLSTSLNRKESGGLADIEKARRPRQ